MEQVPILKERRKQIAGRLSGGERKMLSLGMVLVNRPTLLLYDEPLAGLSEDNIPKMIEMLEKIREAGTTMVVVEHHITEILHLDPVSFHTRIVKQGRLLEETLISSSSIKHFVF